MVERQAVRVARLGDHQEAGGTYQSNITKAVGKSTSEGGLGHGLLT